MRISVALLMDHRSVADWPRWIVVGSTVKLLMVGLLGAGGGGSRIVVGGGGGGGGGTFFLQPAAKTRSMRASTATLSFRYCNLLLNIFDSFSSVKKLAITAGSRRASHCCLKT